MEEVVDHLHGISDSHGMSYEPCNYVQMSYHISIENLYILKMRCTMKPIGKADAPQLAPLWFAHSIFKRVFF